MSSHNVHALSIAQVSHSPNLLCSTVTGRADQWFLLNDPVHAQAQRAASCLLEPEPGDTVLVAIDTQPGSAFILAILTRCHPQDGKVLLPSGSMLHDTPAGLNLHTHNLNLQAKGSTELTSDHLTLRSHSAHVNLDHVDARFDTAHTQATTLTLQARSLSARIGRLVQRTVDYFRHTEKLDETRAGRLSVTVDGHHTIRAGHVTTHAQGFVKIDGQKIDLG